MSLSPQWLDELRIRVTLSAVVGRTTRLTKAGREFKACCPFHNEKSPSFTVNDEKGFYHCFGCGAHGDVIRWMTDQRGLSFMDAVKDLAGEAGMELPAPDPRAAQAAEQRDTLHDVVAAAQDWFAINLAGPSGAAARAYLARRGLSAETIARFGFGWAPDERQALKAALSRFPEALLIEAGLRIVVEDKEPYDRFRGRITLPIHDARGRAIAFGGRILDGSNKDIPKYLNSPDTPLFDKGATLFNLHRAAPAARTSGRLVVVEGYMDVVALSAAGITECVAPLGTALTERQLQLAWARADTPVLCFDGDAAGQRAAMRAIGRALPLLAPARSLGVARLPAGLDPDDLVKAQGVAAAEALLGGAASLIDALWSHERDAEPLPTPEAKAGLKARLLAHVDTIAQPDIRALYRRELLTRFSEFAFPVRDWSKHGNVTDFNLARRWNATQQNSVCSLEDFAHPILSRGDYKARLKDGNSRDKHLRRRLGAAITACLLHFPGFAMIYANTILSTVDIDPRLELIAEACLGSSVLERQRLIAIIQNNGLSQPQASEWDELRWPFTFPPATDGDAAEGLEMAMLLYAGLPQIRFALKAATERFAGTLSDDDWLEQQRLRRRLKEVGFERARLDQAA